MARRRNSNGSGTIGYNADRKRWEGRLTVGHKPDGSLVRRKFTGARQRDVVEQMEAARTQLNLGVKPLDRHTTVANYLGWWLDEVLPGTVAAGTLDNYRNVARLYVIPHVGRIELGKLTPHDVERMLRKLNDEGRSTNSQRLARSVLRRALRRAEQQGVLSRNVAAVADGVKVTTSKGRALTEEQARTLLDATRGDRLEAAWIVALSLGLRRGELLGLTWDDVVMESTPPLLVVRRALRRQPGVGLVLDETKTRGSRRTVHLPRVVADALASHRRRQLEERMVAGPLWVARPLDADLVFRTPFGTPVDPDNFRQATYRLTERALGTRWSPHSLRHSAASILLAQGVPLKTVSEMLGHSSIRITSDVYGHLLAPARQEAADAMDRAFGGTS